MMAVSEEQVMIRMSKELKQKLQEWAERNKWDVSKQIRATLERDYGVGQTPDLPPVPSPDSTPRLRRKA